MSVTSKPTSPEPQPHLLAEYDAVVAKVEAAVSSSSHAAGDQLACRAGCDSCCVAGLRVLPVEAAALQRFVAAQQSVGGLEFTPKGQGFCGFLDAAGRCAVYAARPLLCRTHGLPLKMAGSRAARAERGSLRVVDDDVTVCGLNFTGRAPAPGEILDATAILKLLVVVDRRYRERVGLPDDASRVSLSALLTGAADGVRGADEDADKGVDEDADDD